MNKQHGYAVKRNIAIVLLVALCALSVFAGAVLDIPRNSDAYAQSSANPLHDYVSLDVAYNENIALYRQLTTEQNFKSNLTVKGSTADGSEYTLGDAEYDVTIDFDAATDNVVVSANAAATATLTFAVKDKPAYTSLNVSASGTVYDDNTAETIKDVLTVKGTTSDGAAETIYNKELYSVKLNGEDGYLAFNRSNTVQVFYEGLASNVLNVSVQSSPLQSVTLEVSDDYALEGEYYKNSQGYYAFVQGMTQETVFSHLKIVAHYPSSDKVVSLGTQITGERVTTSTTDFGSSDGAADSLPVTVEVAVEKNGTTKTAQLTLNFRKLEIAGLTLKSWTQPSGLTSASYIGDFTDSLNNCVYYVLNSGEEGSVVMA
ncbi:MAG: hypothetical protein NC350_05675, partial [Corallococcus sp.]|nr:hypothetical protein [Corallococcus sp.]